MKQIISLLQILLLAQHVSGTIMPIIRSSRVLYRWLLLVVFRAVKMEDVIYKLSGIFFLGVNYRVLYRFALGYVECSGDSVCGYQRWVCCRVHITSSIFTARNTTSSSHLYNTLELLMMGIVVPETC